MNNENVVENVVENKSEAEALHSFRVEKIEIKRAIKTFGSNLNSSWIELDGLSHKVI